MAATTVGSMSTAMTVPAVRRELGRQRQSHLAGTDHGDRARPCPARRSTGVTVAGRSVPAVVRTAGRIEPPSSEGAVAVRTIGLTPGTSSTVRRSRAARQQRVREDDRPAAVGRVHDRPAAVADDPHECLELGDERLAGRDPQLDDVALEGRRVAADEARLGHVGRAGEGQPLGQVVELEHALLAEDGQLAALGRRQPVDVEHRDGARRERHEPEQQVLVLGVDAPGPSRPRRAPGARRRPRTGCPRRAWRGRR